MKQAEGWERIYFSTMDDLLRLEWELKFENANGYVIEFGREHQGGVHFNVPKFEVVREDDGLSDVHEDEREYLRFQEEDLRAK